jgi:hypothetical protein
MSEENATITFFFMIGIMLGTIIGIAIAGPAANSAGFQNGKSLVEKQAIYRGHGTYDDNGQFQWLAEQE